MKADTIIKSDIEFFDDQFDMMPVNPPRDYISEYAEEKRILPPNTPFPGPWDNRKTPYLIEPMNNMSPFSPIKHTVIVKGAQLGFTAMAENIIAFYMDECPTEILYISATDHLLNIWGPKRLEPLIDSCGFRNKIFAQIQTKGSRRTGDKILVKEFIGGTLNMASAQSASSLRSDSKRILIRDEIDGAPKFLTTGEGNWIEVSAARTNAWGDRKKILDFSTPTTVKGSNITPLFDDGDQRYYLVPCPFCKKKQILRLGSEKSAYGLKSETKGGRLIAAYYECEFCHDAIYNHQKTEMLNKGEWIPTTKSIIDNYRSYRIGSLYSPVGMLSFTEFMEYYLKAKNDKVEGLRTFIPIYTGYAYKESGTKPRIERVLENRGTYHHKTIPDGVLYLTAGIDVQRGSEKDKGNPARLEMEIMGIGAAYKTWSIFYERFEGDVTDPYDGAWKKLDEWASPKGNKPGGMTFYRKDGTPFTVNYLFIDSGDGNLTDVVYRFTNRWKNTFPSKGFSALKRRKTEKGDEAGPSNFRRYRAQKLKEDLYLYEMSTNYYKTHIYNSLSVKREPTGDQKAGFCDFPIEYGEKYFRMLTAEEKRGDGSFHCPSGTRNEALDCRVMCLCAADVWLDNKLYDYKADCKARGMKPSDLSLINHRHIIDMLNKKYGIKPLK